MLRYDNYYDILRYVISIAKDKGAKRIVILRDGVPKAPQELYDCLRAFNKVKKELNYNAKLDYISVIKRSSVRIFGSNRDTKVNPIQGTYMYLCKLKHFNYYVHEAIIVASKPESEGKEGTTKPIILRMYELENTYTINDVKKIAEEYLALTRLNFWNLKTGASKIALPVKVADQLAYLMSLGVPVKV